MTDEKTVGNEWGSYPETVCYFQGAQEVKVDLRVPVPAATRNEFKEMGLGAPFGILTAFNPRGEDLSDEENSRRQGELEAELVSLGSDFARVDCCSPDRSHCESSVAVIARAEELLELARRWEQLAIFWFDGAVFWIYGATEPGVLRLPVS